MRALVIALAARSLTDPRKRAASASSTPQRRPHGNTRSYWRYPLAALLVVGAAAVALATIQVGDGLVSGCPVKPGGKLRMSHTPPTASCAQGEKRLDLAQAPGEARRSHPGVRAPRGGSAPGSLVAGVVPRHPPSDRGGTAEW